mmetsp:Transcript_4478/g.10810  ORF Transcript_4478/g.10810 Transcript_4478/m.10810 type:complete len:224 (-) Transcript_4478:462-1133(-)|eukprot:CAMPEP_0116092740 /NCGR_PEP_ID=MMETSP0327-20121206/8206_1 /TAXON_ID=44447 /ORGANISM="Pseudo-nitzschia delicatissima, Strain B596" /LENGTH=223 /DNA_ID=CAMNT_0003584191 /DNA_START=167 /DNA_END=838 /DNA_ORIENTATION=-
MGMGDHHAMHDMHHDHASMTMADDSHNALCNEMGMVMYMDGFHWTLKGDQSCLNLFFGSWTLNTVPKFIGAMLLVVALGIATEGINRWKHSVNMNSNRNNNNNNKLIKACLQALSIASAYLLMLVVMTYSLELLLCVVLGLMIGYYVFDGDAIHHSGTPCCNFWQEEPETTMTQALLPRTTDENMDGPSRTTTAITREDTFESCCSNIEDAVDSNETGDGRLL